MTRQLSLFKSLVFCVLFVLATWTKSKAKTNFKSLYDASDFVCVGQIKLISGAMSGDLGTDHYYVTLEVDSIYKQRFVSPTQPIELHWIVSNLRCEEVPMSNCVTNYEGELKVFFLKRIYFFEGAEIPDSLIQPFTIQSRQNLNQLSRDDLMSIEPFKSDDECDESCTLCLDIEKEDWIKVEKHYAKKANEERRLGWMRHRAIKWVMPDRMILASLPSYQNVRFLFITNQREVESLVYYQVGYYKVYMHWIPHVLYKLFNAQAYHLFSK